MIPCNCNYHDSDIGWVINYIKKFKDEQEDNFQKALKEYMDKYFNTIFLDAAYDEDTETIRMTIQDGENTVHYYSEDTLNIINRG